MAKDCCFKKRNGKCLQITTSEVYIPLQTTNYVIRQWNI